MLVDTSVWVDHFRRPNRVLALWLDLDRVWTHPFVIGELACGNLSHREEILSLLGELHAAPLARHEEVLRFIDDYKLVGLGLGWVDMHLLASARAAEIPVWTLDRRMKAAASQLDLAASPGNE